MLFSRMILLLVASQSLAGEKDGFHLLNPTPRSQMREMRTDRPDTTESPISVDAGHVQFELSLVDHAYNDDNGVRSKTLSILPTNIKIGLLNNVDIQFVLTPYVQSEFEADDMKDTIDGFSDDTQIRLKVNLWGNDGPHRVYGDTAFAVMPFIKFPTGSGDLSNDHVEGGIILPLGIELPGEFGLGLMAEVDFVYNEGTGEYGIDFVHTITCGHAIPGAEALGVFIEYIGIAPHQTGGTYQAIVSAGITCVMSDNWILDFGGTVGLSDSADDFSVFIGTSFRL